jgi:hypothetical protein
MKFRAMRLAVAGKPRDIPYTELAAAPEALLKEWIVFCEIVFTPVLPDAIIPPDTINAAPFEAPLILRIVFPVAVRLADTD